MTDTQHIKNLVEEYNINLFWNQNPVEDCGFSIFLKGSIYSYPVTFYEWFKIDVEFQQLPAKSIVVPRPRLGTYAYWVCLHEIGHIACEHRSGTTMGGIGEVEAWRWAIENSRREPSKKVRMDIETSIWNHSDLQHTTKERHMIEHFCMRRLRG